MKNKFRIRLTLGFALFAMFFGAGNLILPPFIGLKAGNAWWAAILGFFTTGILAPFLGVITIASFGKKFQDLGKRINPVLITVLSVLIMLCIGPLIAIPRTASTTFEIGIMPLMPQFNASLFASIFFATVLALSVSKSKIIDIIGNYLTPFLMLSLGILIVLGITDADKGSLDSHQSWLDAYLLGFYEGYQTLDVLAAVIFAGIIINAAIQKGFQQPKERFQITINAGFISMIALLLIYGGLVFLGSHAGFSADDEISRTELLLQISHGILGKSGTLVISIAISSACLTTAIALTSAMGSFCEDISNGKIKYSIGVTITCIISGILSINSVDEIISYAITILSFIYPIVFVLILTLLIFGKKVMSPFPYLLAILVTAFISLITVLASHEIFPRFTTLFNRVLPLSAYDLGWLLPSFLAFSLGILIQNLKKV